MNNKRIVVIIFDGDNVILNIDKNLLFAEFGALDRGSLTNVAEWGIYVNRGSFSFIDDTGFFDNQTTNTIGFLGYIAKFYLVDKIAQTLIGTFVVKSAEIKEETREVTIECVSKLENLQRKKGFKLFPHFIQEPFSQTHTTTYLLVSNLINDYNLYNEEGDNIEFEYGDETNYDITNTFIYCPYFEKGMSLWQSIEKICQASMSRVFDNENGIAVIDTAFPQRTPIIIKPSNIIDIVNSDFAIVPNSSINLTERTKHFSDVVPNVSDDFYVYYDENGDVDDISGADSYELIEGEDIVDLSAKIEKNIQIDIPLNGTALPAMWYERTFEVYQAYPSKFLYTKTRRSIQGLVNFPNGYIDIGSFDDNIFDIKTNSIQDNETTITTKISVFFKGDYFTDDGETTKKIINKEKADIFEIPSNDLIQSQSYFLNNDASKINLGDYILQEVNRRYGKGIECFEIECLFNDYYDITGEKVFDKDDLSNHFKRYDVVIPYVKRGGATVPLRTDKNGEPKQFRIIGISYSYNGILRQKLQLQEERYDID